MAPVGNTAAPRARSTSQARTTPAKRNSKVNENVPRGANAVQEKGLMDRDVEVTREEVTESASLRKSQTQVC